MDANSSGKGHFGETTSSTHSYVRTDISSAHVFYSNVDSLLNKRDELLARVSTEKPDIIALTEIFPKNVQSSIDDSEFYISGYNMFLSKDPKRGVVIYSTRKKKVYKKQRE